MNQGSRIVRIERLFFYVFIFCIPFQTRMILHQWIRPFNEWTSSFVYLTDILLAIVLILWGIRMVAAFRLKPDKHLIYDIMIYHKLILWGWGLGAFFIISAVSVFYSLIPGLAVYRLIKLGEFILFFLYIRSNCGTIFKLNTLAAFIVGSGLFQAVIAIVQYIKQGSVGLKILGESHIGINIYNVAVFIADNGIKYLRSYGTTPHPNVLAAWLVLSLFAFYFWYSNAMRIHKINALPTDRRRIMQISVLVIYGILLVGLLFTFSRTMVGVWGLAAFAVFIFAKKYQKHFYPVAIATIIVGLIFTVFFWPQVKSRIIISGSEEAVTQRILYGEIAEGITKSNPIIGVGIGQFIPDMLKKFRYHSQYFYQPVHNIYLLISSETGLIGIGAFLIFLFSLYWRLIKNKSIDTQFRFSLLAFSFAFLLIGFFDHFLWTLQQGSLIFWLVLAILTQLFELTSRVTLSTLIGGTRTRI